MSQAGKQRNFAVFLLDSSSLALPAECIERVVPAVGVSTLPDAPAAVSGIINFHGQLVAVYNVRLRFGFSERPVRLSDQMIIARSHERPVAIIVDRVTEVISVAEDELASGADILPGIRHIRAAFMSGDGIILIQDLERFLSSTENVELDRALEIFEK